ncbi:Probable sugar phosphate/phosphate translocator At1g53660 [Durusdinium trenchii]
MEVLIIGSTYIVVSAGLITFNKYLMQEGRFPHAVQLTAIHMATTTFLSFLLYSVTPSIYPSMQKAKENFTQLAKFLAPLGILFAVALFCSNKAYFYSSVAFLQFCKQGNVVIVFVASCIIGLQKFSWMKSCILAIVVLGCSLCATGEIKFRLPGLLLQLLSQASECTKNLIGEVVLTGAGLKLDVLTFVAFQASFSLLPLLLGSAWLWTPEVSQDFAAMWQVLLLNALVAFALNLLIALTLKRLSALSFVLIGLTKDVSIVSSSSTIFGDPISRQQTVGFMITMLGQPELNVDDAEEADTAYEEARPQTFHEWLTNFTQVQRVPGVSTGQVQLNRKLAEIAEEKSLDFPGFLQLMQWMLDNDFCDINRLAAKHLEHQSTARDEAWDAASQTPQTWDAFGKLKWETLLSFSYFYK